MKLWKFQIESVLGYLQGGNEEFKIPVSTNHKFDSQHPNIIAFIHDKNKCRTIESSVISHNNTIEQRTEFYKISPYLTKIMLTDFNLHLHLQQ